jgi:hypothetical protein
MNVFRDSTATLTARIARLERENARLRRRERLRSRDRIFSIIRSIAQLLAIFLVPALAVLAALFVCGLFCLFTAGIGTW